MITIIDYGLGNLRSVQKSFERANVEVKISRELDDIEKAEKLVLPGVGNFGKGMENLKNFGLIEVLNEKVMNQKTPILGICLGMQLMTNYSEESNSEGLGWIDARTIRFAKDETGRYKVPHIGWNSIEIKDNIFLEGIKNNSQFYFVHTYYVICNNKNEAMTETDYQLKFHSSFQKDNIYGVQFHPEKSFAVGLQLLQNFSKI